MTQKKKRCYGVFFSLQKWTVILSGPFIKMYLPSIFFTRFIEPASRWCQTPILKYLKIKERLFPCLTEKVEGERWISDTKLLCYLKVRTSSTSYTTDCTSFDGSMFFFHWDIRTKLKHNYLWGVWLCFITTLTPHACNSTHWLQTWASTEAKRKHFGFCSLTLPFPPGIKQIFCILKSLLK